MNDGREYRYQKDWSLDGEMYHVRCDEWDVFIEAKKNMETLIPTNDIKPVVSQPVTPQPIQQTTLGNCPKCGSKMGVSKAGNNYCLAKCWLK